MGGLPELVHPSARCVVEMRVSGPDGRDPQIGSGYLVDTGWVLTAAHVVRGMTSVRAWVDPQVRLRVEDEARVDVQGIRYSGDGADWALVPLIDHDPPGGFVPVVFATLDRTAAEPLSVVALGMPWFKLREPFQGFGGEVEPTPTGTATPGLVREIAAVAGDIIPWGNQRTGTFAVTITGGPDTATQPPVGGSPPPADTADPHGGPHPGPNEARSVWEGMSGAAVWATGLLVGVIATHHPTEGAGTLTVHGVPDTHPIPDEESPAGSPVASDETEPAQEWWSVLPNLRRTTTVTSPARRIAVTYQEVARQLAPALLSGRGQELAELDRFASGADRWRWYSADAFAGKTALLAWWMAHHQLPGAVVVVGCFLRRAARQNTAKDVVNTLSVQMGAVASLSQSDLGQLQLLQGADAAGLSRLKQLLKDAARHCRRLVLVIDGLDEYAPGQVPVAEWLPAAQELPANAALLVTSRAGAPHGIPHGHPLHGQRSRLDPSPVAAQLRALAEAEIKDALHDPSRLDHRIVAFLVAADGPLTHADLATLIRQAGVYSSDIEAVWQQHLARTLTPDIGGHGFGFSHDALRGYARTRFADELPDRRNDLHTWARTYAEGGWRDDVDTPHYLLTGYTTMLMAERDTARLVDTATDTRRHARLRAVTGGDAVALADLAAAVQLLVSDPHDPDTAAAPLGVCTHPDPDLVALARVTWHRDQLRDRNRSTPPELPAVWATLGQYTRAENLARSVPDAARRAEALTRLAETMVEAGETGRLDELAGYAEQAAGGIADAARRAEALTRLAETMVKAGETGRLDELAGDAEQAARGIAHADWRAEALARLAGVLFAARQNQWATALAEAAERVAEGADNPEWRDDALAELAVVLAQAERFQWAERVAGDIIAINDRVRALAGVVMALAKSGDTRRATELAESVERVAETIPHPNTRAWALARLGGALAQSGDSVHVVRVAQRAEQVAGSIEGPHRQADVLAEIAVVLAQAGAYERAEQVARSITGWRIPAGALALVLAHGRRYAQAEGLADTLTDREERTEVLAELAAALVRDEDVVDAARVADEAERIAGTIGDLSKQVRALAGLASALGRAGDRARATRVAEHAERIAGSIRSGWRAQAELVLALAQAGKYEQAERVAGTITDLGERGWPLAGLVRALAQAGKHKQAERVARTISSDRRRDAALTELVLALAQAGKHKQAERLARTITNLDERVQALAGLAVALTRSGDVATATRMAEQAEQLAGTITDLDERIRTLAVLTEALTRSGDVATAARVAEQADRLARSVDDPPWRRWEVMAELAKALARAGDAEEAERVAGTITPDSSRNAAMEELVKTFAQAGDAEEAERIAGTIAEPNTRARMFTWLAGSLVGGGETERAARLAEEAERIVASITNVNQRARAQTELAVALVGSEDTVRAARLAKAAERGADAITGLKERTEALTELAAALWRSGDVVSASRLAEEAGRVAGTITDPDGRVKAQIGLVLALARSGDAVGAARVAEEAERVAETISVSWQRDAALTELVQALAHAGESNRAERVARSITEPDTRAKVHTWLAEIQMETDDTARLAEEAERDARTITTLDTMAGALARLAAAIAPADAGRARRLIAAAWASGPWSLPLSALAAADPEALLALADAEISSTR